MRRQTADHSCDGRPGSEASPAIRIAGVGAARFGAMRTVPSEVMEAIGGQASTSVRRSGCFGLRVSSELCGGRFVLDHPERAYTRAIAAVAATRRALSRRRCVRTGKGFNRGRVGVGWSSLVIGGAQQPDDGAPGLSRRTNVVGQGDAAEPAPKGRLGRALSRPVGPQRLQNREGPPRSAAEGCGTIESRWIPASAAADPIVGRSEDGAVGNVAGD